MARVRVARTNFSAGEVSSRLLGRTDLRAFENGAALLRNVIIHPTGGVSRRPGLRFIDVAKGPGRLVAAEFKSGEVYLLVFSHFAVDVYRDDVRIAGAATPWTLAQLAQLNWVQTTDSLLVVHPDVPPQEITRRDATNWIIAEWSFSEKGGRKLIPHRKIAPEQTTLNPSGTSGNIAILASDEVFAPDHVGIRLRLNNREVAVTEVVSATEIRADVKQSLTSTQPTEDWTEEAFSAVRGWPAAVCFHQDRLVIGGSRDLPNRLWLSRTARLFDFDMGDGLDDEAMEFAILSDRVSAIRAVFSGRHLQVFTSGAEWMVSGEPLTPSNIQLHRQTRIGSIAARTVPPKDVDGATVFVARSGKQIREFLFTDTEQAYQANDLALLSDHLIEEPVDMDLDQVERLLHVVMADGTMATLTVYRNEQVSAWTLQETAGAFRSVAAVGKETFVLVERVGGIFIEAFDSRLSVDAGILASASTAQATWGGLNHLDGLEVKIVADGAVHPDVVVSLGSIMLSAEACEISAGLAFTHVIEPLPAVMPGTDGGGLGRRVRPVALTFRFLETAALYIDTGRGIVDHPFPRRGTSPLGTQAASFTGDQCLRAYGWRGDLSRSVWRIAQSEPLPFTLLSVTTEMSAN
ncbi:MAG: hypothetical protein JNM75_08885 [Rhodospirillales bacterium]|nr:hypothetical protein [Rhodospirillales bacterium]